MVPMMGTFDRDAYNALLKSQDFWNAISAKEVLMVQDDGFLLRRGVEARFCHDKYDYVGAPWRACPDNDELVHLANAELVGNGGVSVRNVAAMAGVCQRDAGRRARSLFFGDTQPIPEDVYFAGDPNVRVCPRREALLFSVEQVECLDALCVHRFWMYNPIQYVHQHCARLLT
jgi:hypothetical protein